MRKLGLFCAAAFSSILLFAVCYVFISEKYALTAAFLPLIPSFVISVKRDNLSLILGTVFAFLFICFFKAFVVNPCDDLMRWGDLFSVRAESCAEGKGSYARFEGRILSVDGKKTFPYKVEVILADPSPEGIYPGCRVDFYAYAKNTETAYALQKGYLMRLSEYGGFSVKEEKGGLFCAVLRFSYRLRDRISLLFDDDEGGLLSALLCGDKSLMSTGLKNSLYRSGLSHIVAVSGLHVSIIIALFVTLFGKKAGYLISLPVLPLYALMTGASPSVLRATVMSFLFILAFLFNSQYDRLTALSVAAVINGIINPVKNTAGHK